MSTFKEDLEKRMVEVHQEALRDGGDVKAYEKWPEMREDVIEGLVHIYNYIASAEASVEDDTPEDDVVFVDNIIQAFQLITSFMAMVDEASKMMTDAGHEGDENAS